MIGRPEPTEAAPYYFTYIDQVQGDDIAAIIERQLDESMRLFLKVTEESSQHRYAPDKWSIRQVLNHATDTERAFAFRAFASASASLGRRLTASLPLPVSTSTNSVRTSSPSAAANRAMASRWASIPKPLFPCLPVDTRM